MALSIRATKEFQTNIWMPVFLWKFKHRRKRRVNKAIKWVALIEDANDAYVFCNSYLKYSFVTFLSICSSFQCFYIVRFEWDIVLSSSYDGWDKRGYTMWCPREGTFTLQNCVWLYLKVVQIQQIWTLWFKSWNCMKLNLLRKI